MIKQFIRAKGPVDQEALAQLHQKYGKRLSDGIKLPRKKGQIIGVVVGKFSGDTPIIGWSLLHKGDTFDKEKGEMIAVGRMNISGNEYANGKKTLPHSVSKVSNIVLNRLNKIKVSTDL